MSVTIHVFKIDILFVDFLNFVDCGFEWFLYNHTCVERCPSQFYPEINVPLGEKPEHVRLKIETESWEEMNSEARKEYDALLAQNITTTENRTENFVSHPVERQYFAVNVCKKCHPECFECSGPDVNQCISCHRGDILSQYGECRGSDLIESVLGINNNTEGTRSGSWFAAVVATCVLFGTILCTVLVLISMNKRRRSHMLSRYAEVSRPLYNYEGIVLSTSLRGLLDTDSDWEDDVETFTL